MIQKSELGGLTNKNAKKIKDWTENKWKKQPVFQEKLSTIIWKSGKQTF